MKANYQKNIDIANTILYKAGLEPVFHETSDLVSDGGTYWPPKSFSEKVARDAAQELVWQHEESK